MMLRVTSLRLAGAALLFAGAVPALAAGDPPRQGPATSAPSDQASDTSATPAETAKPKKTKDEHKICRMVNGSEARLGAQRICMTAEQWKQAQY